MESIYAIPYCVLECPNLKLKRPTWAHMPSAMVVFSVVLGSYFMVTGGRSHNVSTDPIHTASRVFRQKAKWSSHGWLAVHAMISHNCLCSLLVFDKHVCEKINKAYMMLGIIKRNFVYISRNCFVTPVSYTHLTLPTILRV